MAYHVFIAEDESAIRQSLAQKIDLMPLPLKVQGMADNGKEAAAWLRQYHADILVTDIRMPMKNGLELVEELRQSRNSLHTIVISSYDDFDYVRRCLELGVVDYVLKPVKTKRLEAVMAKTIEVLEKDRLAKASERVIDRLPIKSGLLERWSNCLIGNEQEFESLLDETVGMLELWAEARAELLVPLADRWRGLVSNQLRSEYAGAVEASSDDEKGVLASGFYIDHLQGAATLAEASQAYRMKARHRLKQIAARFSGALDQEEKSAHVKAIDQVKKYIEANYHDKLTVDTLAEHIRFSRSYLSVMFKQTTGMTLGEYMLKVRMEKAQKLLKESKLKNYEISQAVGYEDYVHFSKLFKRFFGFSPKEYKQKI